MSPRIPDVRLSFAMMMTLLAEFIASSVPVRTVRLQPDTTGADADGRLGLVSRSCRVRLQPDHIELRPHAQHLGHAPGLRNAAARRERRFRVEHFTDRSDT